MTLSLSLFHYILGHTNGFWLSWASAVALAAPLAFFFSFWIKPIMQKLGGKAW
jgi:hypothetical protein